MSERISFNDLLDSKGFFCWSLIITGVTFASFILIFMASDIYQEECIESHVEYVPNLNAKALRDSDGSLLLYKNGDIVFTEAPFIQKQVCDKYALVRDAKDE